MAQRTYSPQMAKMLIRVSAYQNKHAAKIQANCTVQQWTDLQTAVAAIRNSWIGVQTVEYP